MPKKRSYSKKSHKNSNKKSQPKKKSYSKKSRKNSNKKSQPKKKSYSKKSRKNSNKKRSYSKKSHKTSNKKTLTLFKGGTNIPNRESNIDEEAVPNFFVQQLQQMGVQPDRTLKQSHCKLVQKLYNIRAQLGLRNIRIPEPFVWHFQDPNDIQYFSKNTTYFQLIDDYVRQYPWINPELQSPNNPFWYNMDCNNHQSIY
jgi:hypothetical protein